MSRWVQEPTASIRFERTESPSQYRGLDPTGAQVAALDKFTPYGSWYLNSPHLPKRVLVAPGQLCRRKVLKCAQAAWGRFR